ncbi:hypothetical protein GCM10010503_54850 [Streptomyces lucensis JCM 4490]|uniref:Uncharacterized protein n=1 Tax=Streptomyces lucensis JCM 4490 TaxID=1306176 RepID=A0A918JCH0_9ACTN|nr:hypothetical protein GCM10010503_54850 [Streptomyces lucensis JCM 4490]
MVVTPERRASSPIIMPLTSALKLNPALGGKVKRAEVKRGEARRKGTPVPGWGPECGPAG